jgi:hypothetical protein
MIRVARVVIILTCLFSAKSTLAQGKCPSNLPVGAPLQGCYFVAANGSDTNNGTSESTPWQHAPGMPNCASNCLTLYNTGHSGGTVSGTGIIFRGGDTWHFGNSGASPYTGGTWDLYGWFGNAFGTVSSNCVYEGSQTGCLYVGVDQGWFTGGSWARPILTGDNPTLAGAGNFVASCAFPDIPNPGGNFGVNSLVNMPGWTILDNFELTGLCAQDVNEGGGDFYLQGWASSAAGAISFLTNVYIHGWTATSTAGTNPAGHPVTLIGGGGGVLQVFDHIVIDGQDSNPQIGGWATFPWFYHMRDSIVRYTGQGVGSNCHDIHDNIWEHMYLTIRDGHINILECNADYPNPQSTSTPSAGYNVFYNNIMRHNDPSIDNAEGWWFCPNNTPEYWFNNLMYDAFPIGAGQSWPVAGPGGGYPTCTNAGGQYLFNNTFLDATGIPCGKGTDPNGLAGFLHAFNNHLIGSTWQAGTAPCDGGPRSATNISQNNAQATTQGYTRGSPGTVGQPNNCANDSTTPCAPTSSGNGTVGAGKNLQSYCDALASYTSEYAIGVEAANACRYGATDGCAYDSTAHAMNCPGHKPTARPTSGKWDAGAYQQTGVSSSAPNPPVGFKATLQ